jgi:hypothetical protein
MNFQLDIIKMKERMVKIMKLVKRIETESTEELSEEVKKQLLEKVEFLKKEPIENHNNSWEYSDFNLLRCHEQLEVAYEELFGSSPAVNDDQFLLDWYIEP